MGSEEALPHSSRPARRGSVGVAATALLMFHAAALAYSALCHSPTWDEPAHLVSGISHWEFGRWDLYRVNPPLVRMIAALPVLAAGCETDWRHFTEASGARPEFILGKQLVAANGPRVFWLTALARWSCIPFSLLGAGVCFWWARDLYGPVAGLLALGLWVFDPNVLGHASLITPDVAAASLGAAAGYAFWRWLARPQWRRALVAGLALGLAAAAKTTWAVLFPLWTAVWAIRAVDARRTGCASLPAPGPHLAAILAIGLYVLNAVYSFSGSCRRLDQFQFTSEALSGSRAGFGRIGESGNRFSGTFWGPVRLPLPEDYVLGVDLQRRDFETTPCSYLRGEWRREGWWYYYLYALAVKVPLGTWTLVLAAVWVTVRRRSYSASWCDEWVLLAPMVAVLVLVSSQTGMNHHFRYVLPVFPFAFIWTSKVARAVEFRDRGLTAVASVSLAWCVGASLWVYPHGLSYFNEAVGGAKNGHWHLTNSNIDWGQDLLYLKKWYDEHPEARPLAVAYFGTCDPRTAGIEGTVPPPSPPRPGMAPCFSAQPSGPLPGWYAMSVNEIHRHTGEYAYFLRFEPVAMAGYSIYIYHVTREEADRVRRELGLPELRDER